MSKPAQQDEVLFQGFGQHQGTRSVRMPKAELAFQWGGQRAAFTSWCLDELSDT